MKFILAVIIGTVFTVGLVYKIFGSSRQTSNCVTDASFELINKSAIDRYKGYAIVRRENEIRFQKKGYTHFVLKYDHKRDSAILVGIDGYGMRDKQYHRCVCNLVDELTKK